MKKNLNRKTSLIYLIGLILVIIFLQPVSLVSGAEGDFIESWDSSASESPYDITTNGSFIWILDWFDGKVARFDMEGVYIDSWNVGDEIINLQQGYGITTDGSNFWIVDPGEDEVYKYTMAGVYIDSWDTSGQGPTPVGITTNGTNIWLLDYADHRVYRYNMAGGYIDSWDTGDADNAYSLTTDGSYIYILDWSDDKVYRHNMAGGFINSWEAPGEASDSIYGIATDGSNIWISFQGRDQVFKTSMGGSLVGVWDTGGANDPADLTTDGTNIWIVDDYKLGGIPGEYDDTVHKFTMEGIPVDTWDVTGYGGYTEGITTDGSNIWVVNRQDDEVYKYTMAGSYISSWDISGQVTHAYAYGITTDGSFIWIVDPDADEVYKYTMAGGYVGSWDTSGQGVFPTGITTDGVNIWLVDTVHDEVYKYNMTGGYIGSWDISGEMGTPMGITTYGDYEVGYFLIVDHDDHLVHKYGGPDLPPPTWDANVTLTDLNVTGLNFTEGDTVDVFEWGSSWGVSAFWYTNHSWVFEGKRRYHFQIDYTNETLGTVEQFGLRFTDETNQIHTIWYDKDANTLTVTSPYDGISGWVRYFNQDGTDLTVVIAIMFNKPIPDSYGVQLEIRIVADTDSGWLTPSGGIFNIYNLGGLSTLFKDGTAGRIPGGDIFEIYAADTRTRNIIPTQDFDVRVSNLAPGVQILGIQIIPAEDEQKLLDELSGWKIWMTSRTETRTIYPTNRLPATGVSGDKTYNSYPFGLLIKSDSTTNQSLIIERQFFRKIDEADNEIVTVEVWATVANDTKITGQILISDDGYVDDLIKGVDTDTLRIVDFKFSGNGSIRLVDGIFNIYPATYTGMVWANYTFVIDLTAQTYDFYVDDVLKMPGVDFREAATSVGHISFLDTLNPVFPAQPVEFYVDDVWVHTDFDEAYGGVAEATMLFDMNQHWSMDFDFFVEQGQIYAQGVSGTPRRVGDDYSNYGYVELGWDVMIDKTMVHDFLVARVNITDGYISGKNDWVKFNVSWYSQGVYVKNDLLYGLFEGYSIFPGDSKDTCGWHWDIWFNRANASTIVGSRLNTEYYGMSDKSVWWAIWSSKWQPMRTEVSESTVFIDLEDINGTIHSAQDVSFVRSWVKVLRNDQAQFAYKVMNIAGLDFMIATDTMSGIDTPPIRETVVPEVMSGFFGSALGGIFSAALKRLGNALAGFGMGFFTMSIDFIDAVFAALGYPALVSTIFGWMDSLFASVPILLGYGLIMIGNVFTLINVSASNTLIQLTNIVTIWVSMYSTMMDFLTGVYTPGLNLWNDLGINSFIQIGAILYPFWLFLMGTEKGMQAVIDHLNGMLNIVSFFLNFILNVGGFFMSLLTGLIGAIRG